MAICALICFQIKCILLIKINTLILIYTQYPNNMLPNKNKCACGREFKLFQSLKRHLEKHNCYLKKAQFAPNPIELAASTSQNTNIQTDNNSSEPSEFPELDDAELQRLNKTPESQNTKKPVKSNCIYCEKSFLKHNIKRHQEVYCRHRYKRLPQYKHLVRIGISNIPQDTIEILELYQKILDTQPNLFYSTPHYDISVASDAESEASISQKLTGSQQSQSIPGLPTLQQLKSVKQVSINNIQNIQNNNNQVIQQNIQQNIHVHMNPVCHESVRHITPERQKYIILQRKHAFKALIDSVYEDPANNNIYISDRKGEQVKYLDKEHGVNNGDAPNVIGDVAMMHLGHLDDFIEANKNDVPEHRQNDLKYLEAFLINENNNPAVIKQLTDKVLSMSNTSKLLLDRFQKQKVIDYINSLPEAPTLPIGLII